MKDGFNKFLIYLKFKSKPPFTVSYTGLAITRVILVLTSLVGKTGLNWGKLGLNRGKLGKWKK